MSDGQQQVDFAAFAELMQELQPFFTAAERTM
jgi:3-deoxy-D-arabino-heptulosonate 7-phosphate (DAHP) synthase